MFGVALPLLWKVEDNLGLNFVVWLPHDGQFELKITKSVEPLSNNTFNDWPGVPAEIEPAEKFN